MPETVTIAAATSRSYFDARFDALVHPVAPGAHAINGRASEMLSTVLGSCIAVCLRDASKRIGGLNHFMLPALADGQMPNRHAMLYGDTAMEVLINALMRAGCDRRNLEAKVFGGARIAAAFDHSAIGERNAQFAIDFLAHEGIAVKSRDTGGTSPRRVLFEPWSGRVLVQHVDALTTADLALREAKHRATISIKPATSPVEMF
ncbi:MAG: chemotaxis protein CheD [Bosea sp. (in: a-proteobacteria)]